jgi:RHS repeat-associated protein
MGSRTSVDRPIAVVSNVNTAPALLTVHVDQLNRPVKMTDSSGAIVWNAVWQPWGGAHTLTGSETLNARFPGQWFQLEAGLHYNWHRHYDPSLGRYTQPDPLGFVDGPSVWAYTGSAPFVYVDQSGRARKKPDATLPCEPEDWKECSNRCTPRPVDGCYVTSTKKLKRMKFGATDKPMTLWVTDRKVECNCRDPEPQPTLKRCEGLCKAIVWTLVVTTTGLAWVALCVAM